MDPERYPLPNQVASYGTRAAFDAARKATGQWVFWEDRVELVLAGRYDDVKPLHVELSPTYLCNFGCPWCSCRAAREDWSDEDVFTHPNATETTVMGREKMDRILDHLAPDHIGIQWVGGEPTMNPLFYPAVTRARELGLPQCVFTNGSLLNPKRLDTLFEAGLVFIRVSLDAVSRDVHQVHHGYRPERGYVDRVLGNVRELARRRAGRHSRTLVGISLVVDDTNLQDVLPTAEFLRSLCDEYGHGAIDYVICRPTYQFYTAQVRLGPGTSDGLQALIAAGSRVRAVLEDAGIEVVVPDDSFLSPHAPAPEGDGDACLSCGWFGEVTPNGDMVVCSDRYGNPDYFIGSLADEPIEVLWSGARRQSVLTMAERTSCYRTRCPRNGRGFSLNRIFHRVERFRKEGRMAEVRQWVDDLRAVLPRPEHSFFL
jgi:sulfatase maturation enzyme AslB (radical SAM superfamily)